MVLITAFLEWGSDVQYVLIKSTNYLESDFELYFVLTYETLEYEMIWLSKTIKYETKEFFFLLFLTGYFWFIDMFDVLYEREFVHICKYTVLSIISV